MPPKPSGKKPVSGPKQAPKMVDLIAEAHQGAVPKPEPPRPGFMERVRQRLGRGKLRRAKQAAEKAELDAKRRNQSERAAAASARAADAKKALIATGARIPAFAKACMAKKAKPEVTFNALFAFYSGNPKLRALEATVEAGRQIEGKPFNEAAFWAGIMLANNLAQNRRPRVPKEYLEYLKKG